MSENSADEDNCLNEISDFLKQKLLPQHGDINSPLDIKRLVSMKNDSEMSQGKSTDIFNGNCAISQSHIEINQDTACAGVTNVEQEWTVEKKLDDFLQWCKKNGLNLSPKVKVDFKGTCHRYGMIATEDIRKGEQLFTVPRHLLLNQETASLKNRLKEFEKWLDSHGKSLNDSSGWLPLLITLMWEYKLKDSFWASYLRLVPEISEFGHPLFWEEEEYTSEFKGMPLLNDIIADRENIETEYAEFVLLFLRKNKDLCGSIEGYSLDFFKRMVAFVMAYSFTEDEESPSMVPMADILNHHSNNNAHLVFHKSNLKMISLQKIKKGEEIFNTFGKLGNTELLQMYGYVETPSNQYDSLLLPVKDFYKIMTSKYGTANDDPYLLAKINLLNRTGIAQVDTFFMFDKNGLRSGPDLIQFLKIFHASDRDLEKILKTRAGNRPDSFYHKLLRKLRLSKKTDVSSGVAVIDITDDDVENEGDHLNKRKYIELEDGEGSSKRLCHINFCGNPLNLDTSSQRVGLSYNCSVAELDVGNSTSNAIEIIDESDEENKDKSLNDRSDNYLRCENIVDSTSTNQAELSVCTMSSSFVHQYPEQTNASENLYPDNTVDKIKCEKDELSKSFIISNKEKHVSVLSESDVIDNFKTLSNISNDHIVENNNHDLVAGILIENHSSEKSENGQNLVDVGSSDNPNRTLQTSSTSVSAEENSDDCFSHNKQITFDVSSTDESEEDIEFVNENIPCTMSYDKLKELIQPEWKETVLFVLDVLGKNMKKDDDITHPSELPRNLRNAFYVRQGQRSIINLFRSFMT